MNVNHVWFEGVAARLSFYVYECFRGFADVLTAAFWPLAPASDGDAPGGVAVTPGHRCCHKLVCCQCISVPGIFLTATPGASTDPARAPRSRYGTPGLRMTCSMLSHAVLFSWRSVQVPWRRSAPHGRPCSAISWVHPPACRPPQRQGARRRAATTLTSS